jgi:hypothetical protein
MDPRGSVLSNFNLGELPLEIILDNICELLTLPSLLGLRRSGIIYRAIIDRFIADVLPKTSYELLFNRDANHFLSILDVFHLNPALMVPLSHPAKLFALCLQLTPAGLLRLSSVFSVFDNIVFTPIKTAALENEANWLQAYACYAMFTPDIKTLAGWRCQTTRQSMPIFTTVLARLNECVRQDLMWMSATSLSTTVI